MDQVPGSPEPRASGIAIIIPFYDGSAFLERAVASATAQTLPADELVVVNDGSCASESAWVQAFCTQHGIRLLNQENAGQGAARNAGVAATRAPFICFLDQDDFFLDQHNAILRAAVVPDDRRFGWAYGDVCRADVAGQVSGGFTVKDAAHHPKTSLRQMLGEDLNILPSAALIDRQAFRAVGGFDAQFRGYEDDDLFTRLFQAGFTNVFLDRPVTVWCRNDASTSFGIHMARSRLRYCQKLCAAALDTDDSLMRDCIVPRFAKRILRDARRVQKQRHRFHAHRDELYLATRHCLSLMQSSKDLRPGQRWMLTFRWFKVRVARFGFWRALAGRQ